MDSSEDMLRLCRERVGDRAVLHLCDMRKLELEPRFRLILIACNTLWHCLDDADALTTLRAAREHLTPDGRLVVDGSVPDIDGLLAAGSDPERLELESGAFTFRSELTATVDPVTRVEHDRIVLQKLEDGRVVGEAECEPRLRGRPGDRHSRAIKPSCVNRFLCLAY